MSYQELFEKDYLAAFPAVAELCGASVFEKNSSGEYLRSAVYCAEMIWLQQAKRHEAEIAELVAALKALGASINGGCYRGQDWERACISGLTTKYEAKKS